LTNCSITQCNILTPERISQVPEREYHKDTCKREAGYFFVVHPVVSHKDSPAYEPNLNNIILIHLMPTRQALSGVSHKFLGSVSLFFKNKWNSGRLREDKFFLLSFCDIYPIPSANIQKYLLLIPLSVSPSHTDARQRSFISTHLSRNLHLSVQHELLCSLFESFMFGIR
jgi:hypothetical protein